MTANNRTRLELAIREDFRERLLSLGMPEHYAASWINAAWSTGFLGNEEMSDDEIMVLARWHVGKTPKRLVALIALMEEIERS